MMTMPWSGVCYTVDAAFCLLCCAWPTIPGRCIPTQSFNACRAVFGGTIIKYTSIYMMQFSIIRHVCPVVRRRRGRTLPPPSSPSTVSKGVMAIPLNYHRQASPYRAYIPTGTNELIDGHTSHNITSAKKKNKTAPVGPGWAHTCIQVHVQQQQLQLQTAVVRGRRHFLLKPS